MCGALLGTSWLAGAWCREEAELAGELKRLEAETEDEQLLDAEGDFPATMAPPSRPHRGDDEEEDEEVRYSSWEAVTRNLFFGGSVFSHPFIPCFSLFSMPRSGPSNSAKGFFLGGGMLLAFLSRRNNICRP